MDLTAILLVIFALPVVHDPGPLSRLQVVAESVDALQAPAKWPWTADALKALVLATWIDESGLRESVHSGALRGDSGQAACFGQVHSGLLVPRTEWRASMGTSREATAVCATITARVLTAAATCVDGKKPLTQAGVARIVAMYGTGRTCVPPNFARARAARWADIVAKSVRPE